MNFATLEILLKSAAKGIVLRVYLGTPLEKVIRSPNSQTIFQDGEKKTRRIKNHINIYYHQHTIN